VNNLSDATVARLDHHDIVWCATLRTDGSPHLTPVWFLFDNNLWWIGTAQRNVKVRNISRDNRVSLALLDGGDPIVAEGKATIVRTDFPERVVIGFADKYQNWDVRSTEPDGPRALLRVTVDRWLFTGTPR
jgi:PPOX class probable F420-dependent enzyme